DLSLIKAKVEKSDAILEKTQQEKAQMVNLLNDKKNHLILLKEKEKFYTKDMNRLEMEIEDLGKELGLLGDVESSLLEEYKNVDKQFNALRDRLSHNRTELEEVDAVIQSQEKSIEKKKDEVVDLLNRITDKRSRIGSLESFEKNIDKRIIQIEKQIHLLLNKKETIEDLLEDIQSMEREEKDRIVEYTRLLSDLRMKDKEDKLLLDNLHNEINQNKVDLQGSISKYNLLKNMEEAYEGYYRSVKNLMLACERDEELKKRFIGIVADLLKVDEKYERAIEIALGGNLQNVVTQDERDAKFIIAYLRKKNLGRITFLPLSTIEDKSIYIKDEDRQRYGILGLGSELVNYDMKYANIIGHLLGRIIVVEDLDHAILAAKRFNYSFRIVTLRGDIINPGGAMTGGSLPKVSGNLLNRKHRIGALKKEINGLSRLQKDLEHKKLGLEAKIADNRTKLDLYEEKLQNSNIEVIRLENERERHLEGLKGCLESIEKYEDEIKELNIELDDIKDTKDALHKEIETLNTNSNFIKKTMEQSMAKFQKEKDIREEIAKRATDIQIEVGLLENRLTNKKNKLEELGKDLEKKAGAKKQKEAEYLNMRTTIDTTREEILSTEKDIEKVSRLVKDKGKNIKSLRDKKDDLMNRLYRRQSQLKDLNASLASLEKKRGDWDVKRARYEVKLQGLAEKLKEGYNLNYIDALELWIQLDDLKAASKEVENLKASIKSLGSVNLDSIEEYEDTKNRLKFMDKQYKDLISARKDLQEVIVDMEDKMKRQFLYSFNKIDENFSRVFAILFDGGKANIVLEDEQNILTCGIEIEAQPPGKKLQNLSLLSGGEKTLTAVALLFSIFQVKPAPFCILDEIDAALDESNINRYTNYLKTLSDDTQFIMITHRKGTMEIADVLYGITMEEEGISKIVSVKLTDDLDELAS
ncbi:MAG TPA: chromosome segregation protein SMC, partial [Tepidimicrobium sp.]|nr:chromosome segregation protein SMC [Tepidimicrobium sp.]